MKKDPPVDGGFFLADVAYVSLQLPIDPIIKKTAGGAAVMPSAIVPIPLCMLIDQFMPEYDFFERHSVYVQTEPEMGYEKMLRAKVGTDRITKLLFRLRGMRSAGTSIADFGNGMFAKLGEAPGEEIIFGIVSRNGRFSDCRPSTASDFERPDSDTIRSVINFSIHAEGNGSRVATETRILCGNEKLKKEFTLYWFFVEPFSRLVRKRILKQLKAEMEGT